MLAAPAQPPRTVAAAGSAPAKESALDETRAAFVCIVNTIASGLRDLFDFTDREEANESREGRQRKGVGGEDGNLSKYGPCQTWDRCDKLIFSVTILIGLVLFGLLAWWIAEAAQRLRGTDTGVRMSEAEGLGSRMLQV